MSTATLLLSDTWRRGRGYVIAATGLSINTIGVICPSWQFVASRRRCHRAEVWRQVSLSEAARNWLTTASNGAADR